MRVGTVDRMWVNLGEGEVHVPDIRHGRCDNTSFMRLPYPKNTHVRHVCRLYSLGSQFLHVKHFF